jgi:hypothetical protein
MMYDCMQNAECLVVWVWWGIKWSGCVAEYSTSNHVRGKVMMFARWCGCVWLCAVNYDRMWLRMAVQVWLEGGIGRFQKERSGRSAAGVPPVTGPGVLGKQGPFSWQQPRDPKMSIQ